MPTADPILRVENLVTTFETDGGRMTAVDGISFEVERGRTLGIVGESGCGKSVTAFSINRLLPQPHGRILSGRVLWHDRDLASLTPEELSRVRGREVGMIFQEPMTALNPVHRIGRQLVEAILLHRKIPMNKALSEAITMLKRVRIPAPEERISDYPHQLSGGMKQRIMIAMALINRPQLLIADEPTTALDVTVQAQILALMRDLQREIGMAIILITHDLGVIAEMCDEVVVMYAGRIVERASVKEIFTHPRHAYTKGLLASIPRLDGVPGSRLRTIEGMVPPLHQMPIGCRFCPRNKEAPGAPMTELRPPYEEITPDHWAEHCARCVS